MKTLIVMFFSLMFVGCSSISTKSRLIKNGDSKEQVKSVMGEPEDVQFKGSKEAWQYCVTNFGVNNFSIVWFQESKVIGTTFYKNHGSPGSFCASHFESIRWENAPDSVIEIRNR